MTDTLKAVGNIGAELAAAKADLQREMERHRKTWRELEQARGLLNECSGQIDLLIEIYEEDDAEPDDIAICEQIKSDISAALSQQAEPVCRCTMSQRVLGDGCSVCNPELAAELAAEDEDDEPAPAQDEREVISSYSAPSCEDGYGFGYVDGTCIQSLRGYRDHLEGIIDSIPGEPLMSVAQHERIVAALTRPAQTEQQPVRMEPDCDAVAVCGCRIVQSRKLGNVIVLCADHTAVPIAQAEQLGQVKPYEALQHAVAYLARSPLEAIHSGSALHKLMVSALPTQGSSKP